MSKRETDTVRTVTAPSKRSLSTSRKTKRPATKHLSTSLEERTDWSWNTSSNVIRYGKGFLANLGYTKTTLPKENALLQGIVHARDTGALTSRLKAVLAGMTEELDATCRLRSNAGTYKWYRIRGGVVERDRRGHPVTFSGTILETRTRKATQKKSAKSNLPLPAKFQAPPADVSEQERIEKLLHQTETKFSALFHDAPLAIMLTGIRDDRYLEINEAFEEMTGYKREEVIGKTPIDLGIWVDPSERLKMKEELLSTGRTRIEVDYRTKASEVRTAIASASLIEIDGEHCILGMATDITEHKRAEAALFKSEKKYSALIHQRSIAVVATSMIDDRYLEVNEAFELATGYTQSEVLGKRPIDIEVWENPNERLKFKNKLMASGHGYVEFNYKTKAGEICPAIGSAVLIDIDGEPCMLGMAVDISGRRRAEEALHESEERLRIAIDSVRMYAFEWNPETDAVQLSAAARAILEIDEEDTIQTRAEIVNRILPEDRGHFNRMIDALSPANPSYKVAFRMFGGGQKVVWLEESGRAFFDPEGRLRKVIGMTFDATEARTSEQLLRELSGRLINSQEEERRRVARELHDHIGQELSLLCVQAQSLDSGASDAKQTTHADVHELYGRIKDIAVEVSRLSHRLHSSELAFLGLSAAAERLCRDFKSQHKIDVDYQIANIRGLDGTKSLCFYRILQEALQNIAKHSHATQVVVGLQRNGNELTLKVVDNGIGFDTSIIQVDTGLGLVSIRERLNLVGGQMQIISKVGGGTTLIAAVSVSGVSK